MDKMHYARIIGIPPPLLCEFRDLTSFLAVILMFSQHLALTLQPTPKWLQSRQNYSNSPSDPLDAAMQTIVFALFLFFSVAASSSPRDYCRTGSGPHSSIRKCCLQHNSCPIVIEKGATKYGLNNEANYPLYYCQCELSFYKCLSRVDTGRSVSTRKAHFLEEGQGLRRCIAIEEKKVCSSRLMGIFCLKHDDVLRATLHSISEFL